MADESDIDAVFEWDGDGAAEQGFGSKTAPHEFSSAEDALSVDTVVVEERGRWAVDIVVVFPDGIVRKRVDNHPTKARAELSARLIKKAAERDIRGPLNG